MVQLPKDLVGIIDSIIPKRISEAVIQTELIAAGGPLIDSPKETKKLLDEYERFLSALRKDPEAIAILEELQKKVEEYTTSKPTEPVARVSGPIKGKILNLQKN